MPSSILQNHYVLSVQDVRRSAQYYVEMLDFEIAAEHPGWVFVQKDSCVIMLGGAVIFSVAIAISALSSQKRFPPFAEKEAWKSVWLLTNLLHGHTYPGMDRADHYHTTSVSPSWSRKMTRVKKIGGHKF